MGHARLAEKWVACTPVLSTLKVCANSTFIIIGKKISRAFHGCAYHYGYVHVYVHVCIVKYAILVLKWHISSF